jgi:hypothetical protein
MSLNHRHQYQLRLIEADLLRSDPQLSGMLGVFGRLSAGEAMPAWERVSSRQDGTRGAAALLVAVITIVTAAMSFLLRAGLLALADSAIPRYSPASPHSQPERIRRGRGAGDGKTGLTEADR